MFAGIGQSYGFIMNHQGQKFNTVYEGNSVYWRNHESQVSVPGSLSFRWRLWTLCCTLDTSTADTHIVPAQRQETHMHSHTYALTYCYMMSLWGRGLHCLWGGVYSTQEEVTLPCINTTGLRPAPAIVLWGYVCVWCLAHRLMDKKCCSVSALLIMD